MHSGKIKLLAAERERLDADVFIVGTGPTGLVCALRLSQLFREPNRTSRKPELSPENVNVLERIRELGAQQRSGALMDPGALLELPRVIGEGPGCPNEL